MSVNLRNFTSAVYSFDAVVHRMPGDAWENQSGAPEWTARELLQHQCAVINGVEAVARTGQMAGPAAPEDVTDPVSTWVASREALMATLDRPGVLQQTGPFWFDLPDVDALIGFVQWDLLGHTWDLAQSAGLEWHLDESSAKATLPLILERQQMLIDTGRIGLPVDVPEDASYGARYLGAVGRDPAR